MFKGYIKGIDGLRAIAVIWVMLGHVATSIDWTAVTVIDKLFVLLINSNWVGVQLFFVISGFLITKILLEGKDQQHQIRNFYIRRSLRIFPIYYITLAYIFIALPLFNATPTWLDSVTEQQWWFWTYLNNWSRPFYEFGGITHLWSLAIEEQFYLIWPFIVVFLSTKRVMQISLFMVISAPIARFAMYYYAGNFGMTDEQGSRAAYNFTFARWDAIALGAYLAVLMTNKAAVAWLSAHGKKLLIIVIAVIAVQIVVNHNFTSVAQGIGILNQTTASFAFAIALFFVVVNSDKPMVSFLELSWMKSIGKVSYAMYIFHLPLMMFWLKLSPPDLTGVNQWLVVPVVLSYTAGFTLLIYLMSLLSWHFIEHPILKLKKRYAQ
jgi:peptidoglycan/LPS O-acetylase OafA/YrhL